MLQSLVCIVIVCNGTGLKEFESATFLAAAPAASDWRAPSEPKVPNYTTLPTPLQPPTGSPRRSSRLPATPRQQRPCSPRRARPIGAKGSQLPPRHHRPYSSRRARPVGAKGSQLHHASTAPTAPDGLAPSELKVHLYTAPTTTLQRPTGSPRTGEVGLQASPQTSASDGASPSGSPAPSSGTALNVPALDARSMVLKPCSISGLSKHQTSGTNFKGLSRIKNYTDLMLSGSPVALNDMYPGNS